MKSLKDVKTQLSYEEQRSSSSLQKLSITSQKVSMSKESYPIFFLITGSRQTMAFAVLRIISYSWIECSNPNT